MCDLLAGGLLARTGLGLRLRPGRRGGPLATGLGTLLRGLGLLLGLRLLVLLRDGLLVLLGLVLLVLLGDGLVLLLVVELLVLDVLVGVLDVLLGLGLVDVLLDVLVLDVLVLIVGDGLGAAVLRLRLLVVLLLLGLLVRLGRDLAFLDRPAPGAGLLVAQLDERAEALEVTARGALHQAQTGGHLL